MSQYPECVCFTTPHVSLPPRTEYQHQKLERLNYLHNRKEAQQRFLCKMSQDDFSEGAILDGQTENVCNGEHSLSENDPSCDIAGDNINDNQTSQQIKDRLSTENLNNSDKDVMEQKDNDNVKDAKLADQLEEEVNNLNSKEMLDKSIPDEQLETDTKLPTSLHPDKDAAENIDTPSTDISTVGNVDMPSLEPTSDKKEESVKENEEDKEQEEEEYLDILGNGLLKRKVLKAGDGRESRPMNGDLVVISVEGRLDEGQIVDKNDSLEFTLGDQDVITAIDLGVTLMETGQTIELITDAKYAYGVVGRSPDIPSNARITYTIELLKKAPPPDIGSLSLGVRLEMGEKKRLRGNELFARIDYSGAITLYSKALKILDPNTGSFTEEAEKLQMVLDCRLKCYNNMAACQLKQEYFDGVITSCKEVLDVQPYNTKALYRMGKALGAKGSLKEAIGYLKKAVKLEPETKIIHQELSKLSKKLSQETQSEKAMYRKMLGTSSTETKSDAGSKKSSWSWMAVGGFGAALVAVGMATAYRYLHH